MNIKWRINARKIVLSYLYQYCFFSKLENQDTAIVESLFIDNVFKTQEEKFEEAKGEFVSQLHNYLNHDTKEELAYFLDTFFDQWAQEDIDKEYIFAVLKWLKKYKEELVEQVNKYTQTFSYEQMDTINQALFLLWYLERKELGTPKEILLNELVEISKRYSDEGTPKLINGIMHKIFTPEEESK